MATKETVMATLNTLQTELRLLEQKHSNALKNGKIERLASIMADITAKRNKMIRFAETSKDDNGKLIVIDKRLYRL